MAVPQAWVQSIGDTSYSFVNTASHAEQAHYFLHDECCSKLLTNATSNDSMNGQMADPLTAAVSMYQYDVAWVQVSALLPGGQEPYKCYSGPITLTLLPTSIQYHTACHNIHLYISNMNFTGPKTTQTSLVFRKGNGEGGIRRNVVFTLSSISVQQGAVSVQQEKIHFE